MFTNLLKLNRSTPFGCTQQQRFSLLFLFYAVSNSKSLMLSDFLQPLRSVKGDGFASLFDSSMVHKKAAKNIFLAAFRF
jgi:hypothetical protein